MYDDHKKTKDVKLEQRNPGFVIKRRAIKSVAYCKIFGVKLCFYVV